MKLSLVTSRTGVNDVVRFATLAASIWLVVASVRGEAGVASWYGEDHRGRLMANGERFNPDLMTCASWKYPFGTKLKVSLESKVLGLESLNGNGKWQMANSKAVIVTVTDRGPNHRLRGRVIDLSEAAFARIADRRVGLVRVRIAVVK